MLILDTVKVLLPFVLYPITTALVLPAAEKMSLVSTLSNLTTSQPLSQNQVVALNRMVDLGLGKDGQPGSIVHLSSNTHQNTTSSSVNTSVTISNSTPTQIDKRLTLQEVGEFSTDSFPNPDDCQSLCQGLGNDPTITHLDEGYLYSVTHGACMLQVWNTDTCSDIFFDIRNLKTMCDFLFVQYVKGGKRGGYIQYNGPHVTVGLGSTNRLLPDWVHACNNENYWFDPSVFIYPRSTEWKRMVNKVLQRFSRRTLGISG